MSQGLLIKTINQQLDASMAEMKDFVRYPVAQASATHRPFTPSPPFAVRVCPRGVSSPPAHLHPSPSCPTARPARPVLIPSPWPPSRCWTWTWKEGLAMQWEVLYREARERKS